MNTVFATALVRAILSAVIVGAGSFLALWAVNDDPGSKAVLIGTFTPMLGILATRFAAEGWIDTKRA